MKLIRFGPKGAEKPGIETANGSRYDVSAFCNDYDQDFFASEGPSRLSKWVASQGFALAQVAAGERIGPPIANPSMIICVGLNYAKHALESKMARPEEPVLFFKSTTAITGPFDPIVIPPGSTKTDWEVELAVVIGKKASYVSERDAMQHVAGYLLHNDVSERAYQLERGGQWVKGKSCDTFAPIGPYLVTADEIADPHHLDLWLKVNGELMQSSNTSDLIFNIPTLVSYISQFMTLLPGDIISTGTPAGVGLGFDPPRYLKKGDVVELGIDGLGSAKQPVE
jgi:2-keto-4-pentenoate hydratase/2-oxohepta-3-ene-1,7-dioic acid hydratase in catechol pathway